MAELVYYVASTLDGFIAHEDGSFDGFEWDDEVVSDFFSDLKEFGTVLMGRKTYEVGLREGKTSPYPSMRQVVFSRTMEGSPDAAVELVRDDVVEFVRACKFRAAAPIWLCGGSEVASLLANSGLIDRVTVKLNPVVFGPGIPIFRENIDQMKLDLQSTKSYDCGIVLLDYTVVQSGGTG
ncbi:MAG: dihydrofolate reductase family protein [Rhodothermales bacterium]